VKSNLKQLRFPTIHAEFEKLAREAATANESYEQYLPEAVGACFVQTHIEALSQTGQTQILQSREQTIVHGASPSRGNPGSVNKVASGAGSIIGGDAAPSAASRTGKRHYERAALK
jgi:hypothetical protein